MDAKTMSLDECRDWLAEDAGWSYAKKEVPFVSFNPDAPKVINLDTWRKGTADFVTSHPFPATLDAAAGALPEGWWYFVNHCAIRRVETYECRATTKGSPLIDVSASGDTELLARFRLAVACRMAMKAGVSTSTTGAAKGQAEHTYRYYPCTKQHGDYWVRRAGTADATLLWCGTTEEAEELAKALNAAYAAGVASLGIPDPAGALEAARKALDAIASWSPSGTPPHCYTRDEVRTIARDALALLAPKAGAQ